MEELAAVEEGRNSAEDQLLSRLCVVHTERVGNCVEKRDRKDVVVSCIKYQWCVWEADAFISISL